MGTGPPKAAPKNPQEGKPQEFFKTSQDECLGMHRSLDATHRIAICIYMHHADHASCICPAIQPVPSIPSTHQIPTVPQTAHDKFSRISFNAKAHRVSNVYPLGN